MVHEAVAQRYASALFGLGQQQGDAQTLLTELRVVEARLDAHPALSRALQAPNVPDSVKKSICRQLFSSTRPYILNFLFLLVDKKREAYVGEIARQYSKLLDESLGMTEAEVETAVPMSDKVKQEFAIALGARQGRKVKIDWSVNPELLGGYVLRQGDRLLDNSFKAQLNELQHRLQGV